MTEKTKRKLKRLLSAVLALAVAVTFIQIPVFAEGDPIYLPDAELSEAALNCGAFNLSVTGAELDENAGAPYLFRVQRGGDYLPEAELRLDMIDITAKYGDDYTVKLYDGGESVENSKNSKSIIDEMIEHSDEIEEENDTDYIISGEMPDTEEELEAFKEDAEIGAEYVAEMFGLNTGAEPSEEPAAEPSEEPAAEPSEEPAAEPSEEPAAEASEEPAAEPSEEPSEANAETANEGTAESGAALAADASTLRGIKSLATGLENDIAPMDGGNASTETSRLMTEEMLNGLAMSLESAYLPLNFSEGETEKYIAITPKDNSKGDGDRMLTINLVAESQNAIVGLSGMSVSIIDDEVQEEATVEFSDAEYHPSDGYIKVKVVRSGAINQVVSVKLSTEDETAVKDRDYSQVDTTLVFPYGVSERTINIPTRSDYAEENASFKLKLHSPVSCELGALSISHGVIDTRSESFDFKGTDHEIEDGAAEAAADATVSDIILGEKQDLNSFFNRVETYGEDAASRVNEDEIVMTLPGFITLDTSIKLISDTGRHYDYSGYQLDWTKESGLFNFSHTRVNGGAANNEERWPRRKDNFFRDPSSTTMSVELYTNALVTSSTKLTIHSITPILRPYEVSLAPSEPLKFLNENGEYVENTKIARLKNANDTILQNASTNGKGTAVKFSGDYITVTTNSPYSYISGLEIVNPDTGASRLILNGLKPGTTSASVQLDNDFMTTYSKYIKYVNNGNQGQKGQFQVRAVLDYYDVGVNIHEDPNASVTMTNIEPPSTNDNYITSGDYYIKSATTGKYLKLYIDNEYSYPHTYPNDAVMDRSEGTPFTVIPASEYRGGVGENSVVIALSGGNYGLSTAGRPMEFGPNLCHCGKLSISSMGGQNMFTIAKQDDGTYVISDLAYHAVSESGNGVSYEWSYHPERLTDKAKWILEPANAGYKKDAWTLHRGDTVKFTQNINNAQYKSSRIRFVTRETSTAEEIDVRRAYDKDSADTCTMFCDYSSIDVYPSYEESMQVIVRVSKKDYIFFQKDKGIFTCPRVENGDYYDYIVTDEDHFAESMYYEYSAYGLYDGYVPIWNSMYAQNTYYFRTHNVARYNVIPLSIQRTGSQKYVLTGSARYSDTSINGTAEGSAWMPAKGAYVLMGSTTYGISDDDGNITTIAAPGILDGRYRVIYKTVASGMTSYREASLRNGNMIEYTENTYDPDTGEVTGTITQSAYAIDIGTLLVSPTDRSAPYPEAFVATMSNGVQTDTVQINDDITDFDITINNNHAAYTDTDGVEREEKVTAVDVIIYDGQTNAEKTVLSGAKEVSDEGGISVWRLGTSFARGKPEEYRASDKVYVRITTDKLIGNGNSVDADGNETPSEALSQTVYAPVYTGYTLSQSNTQQPVTQDINPQTYLNFVNLPFIGAMDTSFLVSFISLSITELPNGGERLSFGISPTCLVKGDKIKNVETEVDYGLSFSDIKQAFSETKEWGDAVNMLGKPFGRSHYLGMRAFAIRPIFGLYLDFGLKSLNMNNETKMTMSFMGGGLFLGGSAYFRATLYLTIGWLPIYFGVDGELTIYTQVGVSSITNAEDVTPNMIMSESNTFEDYFVPSWCLQANVIVAVYAGVGLCGTLGVRGGFQLDMNFMYNITIQKLYPGIRNLGAVLDFKFKLWVDALLFSIPIPVASIAKRRYGYYEDIAKSDIEGGFTPEPAKSAEAAEAEDEGAQVVMRPRNENQSEWLPNGGVSAASTFEEASTTVLLENGYDRADPQLIDLGGGRTLLVFIADDPTRGDSDRTALMYSVYENGTWSQPVKIQDDGKADFEPDLCDAGDKILITWTSRNADTPSASETDYLKSMDVYAATLDKQTLELSPIEQLTNDTDKGFYDSAPVGLYDDTSGDMLVYYLKSEVKDGDFETSVMPTKNESVIVYMLYDASNGQWARDYYYPNEVSGTEAEQELIKNWGGQRFLSSPIKEFGVNSPVIIDFDAISYNGIGLYTFTVDQDNNMDTDADRELFLQAYDFDTHTTYVPVRITEDNLADARPQLVRNGDHTYLFWLENNKDIRYINVTDLIKNGVNPDGSIIKDGYELNIGAVFYADTSGKDGSIMDPSFGSYNAFVDKDNNLFITWLQPIKQDDGTSNQEIYATALIRDENGMSWSDGVRLTDSGAQNDEVAFLTDENGDLLTVGNRYKVDFTDDAQEIKDMQLIATNYKTVGSLDVTAAEFTDTTPTAGSENEVTITVKNTGLKTAKGYTMDIYEKVNGAVGEKLETITSDEAITPSSAVSTEFTWTMPESYEGIDDLSLYITVNEAETSEISEFTSDSIDIRPEYNITSCEVTESSDGFYLTYTIENTGNADAVPDDEESADKFKVKFNNIYYKVGKPETYLEVPIAGLAVGETQTNTMRLEVPEDKFEFGYSEAYAVVENKDENIVSNYEAFRLILEYPYNISINGDSYISRIELKEGESIELNADYSPKEFYAGGTVKYSVADASVASVEGNTLTAEAAGETELTAIVEPYGGYKTVTVAVQGEQEPEESASPTPDRRPSYGGGIGGSDFSTSASAPTAAPEATLVPEASALPKASADPETTPGASENEQTGFKDVSPDDWFYESVKYVSDNGYFTGASEDMFEPDASVTRGMFAAVLGRMSGVPSGSADTGFTDVDRDEYYAPYIAWAAENGIVLGYGDGTFGPEDLVTREQAAAMMWRYAQYIGADVSAGENADISGFADSQQVSEYAASALRWACGSGIIVGDNGALLPQNNATRAETAAIIERFDKLIKQ